MNFVDVSAVLFGNSPATIIDASSSTSLTVLSPPGVTCVEGVTVVTCTEGTSTPIPYTYNFPAPAVTGAKPKFWSISRHQHRHHYGTDFAGITSVKFGTQNALSFSPVSLTSITAEVPPGLDCVVDVVVSGCSGMSPVTPADEYAYNFTHQLLQVLSPILDQQ